MTSNVQIGRGQHGVVTGQSYPAPGSPIGTCMVFSYLAGMNMVGR